jgi:uroporphyrinogen III methyltransferase/synthase
MIANGRAAATPAAAVRWATRPRQQTVVGTLSSIAGLVEADGLKPPTTFVIGEVVRLREKLGWFERLPLSGRRIVVTRAQGQAGTLAEALRALGADAIELPAIEIRPPADMEPLDRAIARLPEYDWLIFTSVNGVRFFLDRLDASSFDLRNLRARLCTIGPATRAAVEALHLKVDVMPQEYVAEGLLQAFDGIEMEGKRVLLPRAAVARDLVPAELAKRGARVDVVEAYRTTIPEASGAKAQAIFGAGPKPDWVTFTSSSTVKNFLALAGREALEGAPAASIGPVTSATLRMHAIDVSAEAQPYTTDGLIAAICAAERRYTGDDPQASL